MTITDALLLTLLVVLLLMAVFLALAEASLLRVSEVRARTLASSGDKRARRLATLVERRAETLSVILLLALLSQIGAATIAGVLAQRWFGQLGITASSVVLTVVLFVYGEAIPKTYAVRHAEKTALAIAGPVLVMDRVLRPVVAALVWISDVQMPGKGITTSPTVTEEELRLLADEAAVEGEITHDDRQMIERAFRFGDRRADDVMVPRPDIVAVEENTSIIEALDTALAAGHRRLPIYSGVLENITGVVRLRDLIKVRDDPDVTLRDVAGEPLVIPESKRITSLLTEMQAHNNHLALVVDEYGVTVGLVTVEDVAAELLGTISDGHATEDLTTVGPSAWTAPGSLPVEDLESLGVEPPEGDWNTVAGLMLGVSGRLLKTGDEVTIGDFILTAEAVTRRRVVRVGIRRSSTGE